MAEKQPQTMEVLLGIGESLREFQVVSGSIIKAVEEEIGAKVLVPGNDDEESVIFQQWTAKWGGTYVDVRSKGEIQQGDKLRVVPVPNLKAKNTVCNKTK